MIKKRVIQLGCFDQPKVGWENYDITPHIFISRIPLLPLLLFKLNIIDEKRLNQHRLDIFKKVKYLNLNKRLPFQDNSIDAYFSSHVFEHLFLNNVQNLLREIYRTLKTGGVVRTVLPDLSKIIYLYSEENPNEFLEALFENNNSKNYKNFHKWMYTPLSFSRELELAGFSKDKIKITSYKKSNYSIFDNMDNRPSNSFYIESQK